MLDGIVGADIMKEQLAKQVKAYADTFAEWIDERRQGQPADRADRPRHPGMMPAADEIIGRRRERSDAASRRLTASQARTSNIIIGVGCAAVADRPRASAG